jgi:hypothetical protein
MKPSFFNHLLLFCQFELNRSFATRKGLLSLVTFAVVWYFILLYPLRLAADLMAQEHGIFDHLCLLNFIGLDSIEHSAIPEFDVFWQLALIIFPVMSITLAADQTCSDRNPLVRDGERNCGGAGRSRFYSGHAMHAGSREDCTGTGGSVRRRKQCDGPAGSEARGKRFISQFSAHGSLLHPLSKFGETKCVH